MRMSHTTSLTLSTLCAGAGLWAILDGVALIYDPTGSLVGFPPEVTATLPGHSLVLAGLLFASLLGVGGLAAAVEAARAKRRSARIVGGYGLTLLGWMAVQLALMGLVAVPQQLTMTTLGIAIAVLGVNATRGGAG